MHHPVSDLCRYLHAKPEAVLDYPFGPDVAVYKVLGKLFALVGVAQGVERVNLKCDPLEAVQLRDVFAAVLPGYHMNKRHWNTVVMDGSIPWPEIERMVDQSYALVVRGLPKRERLGLEARHGASVLYPDAVP
ncbi:MAG: MmcQ/YjbR family DNA-binding protein [Gammaproteobacteria bacterium]|nr:MmcQ/YjbR family DNA-binding protein [Gammaproteobacteria bacterium]